ncbi:MAG: hypothetical protein JXQ65_06295 [Candidatus Marinimicrobia bacterium]|nr:hypothetical protein [Candidatus Neomarinimicrobiota bacterium]
MYRSLFQKEWIKLRWAFLAFLVIGYAALFSIASDLHYGIKMHGAVKYWSNVITYHSNYFSLLKSLPVLGGIAIALLQFVPESINRRYRLFFHLPINEQKILLFMLWVGTGITLVIDGLILIGLYAIATLFFPAEIVTISLLTTLPWFLAGIITYLGVSTLAIEPSWVQKIAIGVTTYFTFDLLLSERNFAQYNDVLVYYLLITLILGIIILYPGHRLRKGSK